MINLHEGEPGRHFRRATDCFTTAREGKMISSTNHSRQKVDTLSPEVASKLKSWVKASDIENFVRHSKLMPNNIVVKRELLPNINYK